MGAPATTPQPGGAYERLVYPGFAYAPTHPAHLEVVARLFGLSPAPADACRVLELGCGDGANVLAMAQTLPGSTFIGLDAAAGAIERGGTLARRASLQNIQLRVEDLERLPDELGEFDYVVAHGVYSWIAPAARDGLLECCRRHLAPHGVAYVSYNAYPGSYLRGMARDILRYHLRDVESPQDRLAGAHELMRTIVAIEDPSPYGRALREQLQRTLDFSDALLFHDDLAEISTPFYFHEFVEHAAAHGLGFLSEALLADSQMRDVPESAAALMASLPDDVVVREQHLDFFRNRMFRRTLLCHAETPVRRELDDVLLEQLAISSAARRDEDGAFVTPDGVRMTTDDPIVTGAMDALAAAWPAALDFDALLSDPAEVAAARLRAVLLEAYLAGAVRLHSVPAPVASRPGERPLASPLARAQRAVGADIVSSLLHTNVSLRGDIDADLLPLLDGNSDRGALRAALGSPEPDVEAALQRLAALGLLQG